METNGANKSAAPKRKSGFQRRAENKVRKLKDAAASCSRIAQFFISSKEPVEPLEHSSGPSMSSMCPESSREDPNHPNKTREESDACPEISEENPQPSELNVTRKESKSLETETGPRVKEPSVVTHITCTEEDSFDFFKKPSLQDLDVFFGRHPFQPDDSSSKQKLPFEQSIYFSHLDGNETIRRSWISYNERNKKLYCSICLAFSEECSASCEGYDKFRRTSQALKEHEKSRHHTNSIAVFLARKNSCSIDKLLLQKQLEVKNLQVARRRQVLSTIIELVEFVGSRPYLSEGGQKVYLG